MGAAAWFGVAWPTFKRGEAYLQARPALLRFERLGGPAAAAAGAACSARMTGCCRSVPGTTAGLRRSSASAGHSAP